MRVGALDPGARETLRRLGVETSAPAELVLVPDDAPSDAGLHARTAPVRRDSVEAILDEILRVGGLVGRGAQAESLMVEVRERMNHAQDYVNPYADPPAAVLIARREPIEAAGGFLAQLLERAGANPMFNPTRAAPGHGSASGPQMAYRRAGGAVSIAEDDLAGAAIDHAVLAPCDTSFGEAIEWGRRLVRRGVLPARTAVVDPTIFHAGGPRIADVFEWLVAWIHERPELMPDAVAWEPIRA